MANRKNRKLAVKNSNKVVVKTSDAATEIAVSTLERPPIAAKPALSSRVNKINPTNIGRSTHVASEIKRSVICAAITLAVMAALYFIFR